MSMNTRKLLIVVCASLLFGSTAGLLNGQALSPALRGRVTDPSGAVVPNAVVDLSGPGGKQRRSTGGNGEFAFPRLTSGTYQVQVSATGFNVVQKNLWKSLRSAYDLDRRFAHLEKAEKEKALELFCISIGTNAARKIQMFRDLGMADAIKRGDEKRFLLALIGFKQFQDCPQATEDQRRLLALASKRKDHDFIIQMGKVRKKPPIDSSKMKMDRINEFLLKYWDTFANDKNGKPIPPLCYFTDKALASAVQIILHEKNVKPDTIRKRWERLGLLKAKICEVEGLKITP